MRWGTQDFIIYRCRRAPKLPVQKLVKIGVRRRIVDEPVFTGHPGLSAAGRRAAVKITVPSVRGDPRISAGGTIQNKRARRGERRHKGFQGTAGTLLRPAPGSMAHPARIPHPMSASAGCQVLPRKFHPWCRRAHRTSTRGRVCIRVAVRRQSRNLP